MFVALGSTILLPAVHAILVRGVRNGLQGFAVNNIAIMVLLDFLALFFYLSHIPYVFPDSPFPFLGQLWSLEACLRSFGFPDIIPRSILIDNANPETVLQGEVVATYLRPLREWTLLPDA